MKRQVTGTRRWTLTDPATQVQTSFILSEERRTWSSAEEQCKKLGGHLAVPSSKAKNQFLQGKLKEYFKGQKLTNWYDSVWFGASKTSGEWKFVTGERVNYTNWLHGQADGSGDKACFSNNPWWQWDDTPGDITHKGKTGFRYICEVERHGTLKPKKEVEQKLEKKKMYFNIPL